MFKSYLRQLSLRPALRIGLAVLIIMLALAPVGAPILSDGEFRHALAAGAPVNAPGYLYRWVEQGAAGAAVQRSADDGRTWRDVSLLPARILQMEAAGAGSPTVFARAERAIFRSEDAGQSWTETAELPSRPLSIAVSQDNGPVRGAAPVLLAGTESAGLLASYDRGASWSQSPGAPATTPGIVTGVTAVAIHPDDARLFYAAAGYWLGNTHVNFSPAGVLSSPDSGRHWFQMVPQDGSIPVRIDALQPDAARPLIVHTGTSSGSLPYELEVTPELLENLASDDADLRAATARMIGLSGQERYAAELLPLLKDGSLWAGDQAAEAIGRLGNAALAPQLYPLLDDTVEDVRARAARALGLLGDEQVVSRLAEMLTTDGPVARRNAAEGLAAIGTPAALDALLGPLSGDDDATRQAAMRGIETVGSAAVKPLVTALDDPNPVLRRNAAEALGWLRSPAATGALVERLSDRDPSVRAESAWALGEIGGFRARQALLRAARFELNATVSQALADAALRTETTVAVGTEPRAARDQLVLDALSQVPADRWTILALGTLLAVAVLILGRGRITPSGGTSQT